MSTAARQEIEMSATRGKLQFWRANVEQSMRPDVGLKRIKVKRGIVTLPDGNPGVGIEFSHFGYRAGTVEFSGYPTLRRFKAVIGLEAIGDNSEWRTKKEYEQMPPEQRDLSPMEEFIRGLTFP